MVPARDSSGCSRLEKGLSRKAYRERPPPSMPCRVAAPATRVFSYRLLPRIPTLRANRPIKTGAHRLPLCRGEGGGGIGESEPLSRCSNLAPRACAHVRSSSRARPGWHGRHGLDHISCYHIRLRIGAAGMGRGRASHAPDLQARRFGSTTGRACRFVRKSTRRLPQKLARRRSNPAHCPIVRPIPSPSRTLAWPCAVAEASPSVAQREGTARGSVKFRVIFVRA